MDYLVFIFKGGKHYYIVSAGSIDEAYDSLQKRQSISMERVKNEYKLVNIVNENSDVVKL